MKRTRIWIGFAAASLTVGLGTLPALSAPSDARVSEVYQLPCSNPGTCDPEVDASRLVDEGDPVAKEIQVWATSTASLGAPGFDWVELEARRRKADDSWTDWVCLNHWGSHDATSFEKSYDWDTREWPETGDCRVESSSHGGLTRNGEYELRVVAVEKNPLGAKESVGERKTEGSPVRIVVVNKPSVPSWAGDPVVFGESERKPLVELQWDAVPQQDVVEYHFVREGPHGDEVEFAVSATNSGGQGCDLSGGTYTCPDDAFPDDDYGGTYSYRLIALRWSATSTGDRCALPPQDHCVRSSSSDSRAASIEEVPAPSPDGSGTPSGSDDPSPDASVESETHDRSGGRRGGRSDRGGGGGSSSASSGSNNRDFYSGTYDPELPYNRPARVPAFGDDPALAGGETLASDVEGPIDDRILLSVAGGLLLMMIALHMGRLLRDR